MAIRSADIYGAIKHSTLVTEPVQDWTAHMMAVLIPERLSAVQISFVSNFSIAQARVDNLTELTGPAT